ncbi:hypothetical protein B296_00039555 [Ensete ventricosum]|uniref:Uncharacterized protein n=1 Tax=Ensete ventricosum TaxID=4639 RepID=A0A426Y2L7_ENSVE|nr:hypothetical protein B296_00039555 [Ensete ventricosum]
MFKHYASVHFFWSLYFLEENVERDAVHKALMSLLRQDVKGNPKLSVSDLYKSWAELVQLLEKESCSGLCSFMFYFTAHLISSSGSSASLTALFRHVEIGLENVREKVICFLKDKVSLH